MKRSEVTTGIVYAVQLMQNGQGTRYRGPIVPGFLLSADTSLTTRRSKDTTQRHVTKTGRPGGDKSLILVVQGRLRRDPYNSHIDALVTAPYGSRSQRRPELDASTVAERLDELTAAALVATAETSTLPEGYVLYEAESRDVLGEWNAYWSAREEKSEVAKQTAAAAEAEADAVWEAAAAPLRVLAERVEALGLPLATPDLDRRWSGRSTVPATTFRIEAVVLARLLDALPEGWTFSTDPATAEDGWSWEHRAGNPTAAGQDQAGPER